MTLTGMKKHVGVLEQVEVRPGLAAVGLPPERAPGDIGPVAAKQVVRSRHFPAERQRFPCDRAAD